MTDRIHRANARSRRVPLFVLRLVLAMSAGGILLAVLVPPMHARGIALESWMAWGVVLACLVLALWPDLARWISRRQG